MTYNIMVGCSLQALEALVRLDLNHIRKEVRNEI